MFRVCNRIRWLCRLLATRFIWGNNPLQNKWSLVSTIGWLTEFAKSLYCWHSKSPCLQFPLPHSPYSLLLRGARRLVSSEFLYTSLALFIKNFLSIIMVEWSTNIIVHRSISYTDIYNCRFKYYCICYAISSILIICTSLIFVSFT